MEIQPASRHIAPAGSQEKISDCLGKMAAAAGGPDAIDRDDILTRHR